MLYLSHAYEIEYGFVDPLSYSHIFGGGAWNKAKLISNVLSGSSFSCGDTVTLLTKILAPPNAKASSLVLTFAFSRASGGLYPLLHSQINYGPVAGGAKGPFTVGDKDGFLYGIDTGIFDNGNSAVLSVQEKSIKGKYIIDVEVGHISGSESVVLRLDMLYQCPTSREDLVVQIIGTSSPSSRLYPDQLVISYSSQAKDCSDKIYCTLDGLVNDTCSHYPDDTLCSDSIPCTDDKCTETGCISTPNDALCSSVSKCIQPLCDAKLGCVETPMECVDFNECTTDSCDPVKGCQFTPVSCDDGVTCTDDACVPETGCTHTPNHNMCDDGSLCTSNLCSLSGCVYPKIPCECTEWSERSECQMECDGWFISKQRTCDCPSECNVPITDTVPCKPKVACTYNTDYWKLHPNEVLRLLNDANIQVTDNFLKCQQNSWDFFNTWYIDVNQYPWADLARQFLAAKLNHLNGVSDIGLESYLSDAEIHFSSGTNWCIESVPSDLYYGLVYINEGMSGPGNCIKPACCISKISGPCEDGERYSSTIALCTKVDLTNKWLSDCADCGNAVEEC